MVLIYQKHFQQTFNSKTKAKLKKNTKKTTEIKLDNIANCKMQKKIQTNKIKNPQIRNFEQKKTFILTNITITNE